VTAAWVAQVARAGEAVTWAPPTMLHGEAGGGSGGSGGRGGHGGGGGGGPAIGIMAAGSVSSPTCEDLSQTSTGTGGPGGASAGNTGEDGLTGAAIGAPPACTGELGCPSFKLRSFAVAGGRSYVRFGEALTVSAEIEGTPDSVFVTVEPQSMAPFLKDLGRGTAELKVTEGGVSFATTPLTFTVHASSGDCSIEKETETSVKVLGNLWVTNTEHDVVQCFRSNGSFVMQALGSTYLSAPYSILGLDEDRILVGNHRMKRSLVEVFDKSGAHQYAFEIEEQDGSAIFGEFGADTIMLHPTTGEIWVGGPQGYLVAYSDDGTFLRKLDMGEATLLPRFLLPLPDGTAVLVPESVTTTWDLHLLDTDASLIGSFGNNSAELEIEIYAGAVADEEHLVFSGSDDSGAGYVALLRNTGQMVKRSQPAPGNAGRFGVVPFGDGFLVISGAEEGGDRQITYYDSELNLVTESFTGEKRGHYRGMMILGGN
jgi:hypothetical protein